MSTSPTPEELEALDRQTTEAESKLLQAEAVIRELMYSHHHRASMMERQYDKAIEMAQRYLCDFDGAHDHMAAICPLRAAND